MAPKKSKTIKTKAKRVSASLFKPAERVSASSSKPAIVFDKTTFETVTKAQRFENVIQHWTIWPEREINLDELPLAVHRNLQCRNWLSLCKGLQPPPVALIREFYANLEIRSDNDFATWIRGRYFVITKNNISNALDVPRVRTPTYPYSDRPLIFDVMTLLCGRSMTLGFEPRINSSDLTELNYILFRIACHNIFPISHVHTIPRERCYFLYALVTDASICFASLFYETLVRAHRSKSKKHGLFFPVFIYRILRYVGVQNFPSLELIHITAPIGATFLKQRTAQKRSVGPSVGSSKRPWVQSTTGDDHAEQSPVDPTGTVADIGDDGVHAHSTAADPTVPPPLSLCAMMETIMTTQAAHGQLLDGLIAEVAALRADFSEYSSAFPPPPPSESWWLPLAIHNRQGK